MATQNQTVFMQVVSMFLKKTQLTLTDREDAIAAFSFNCAAKCCQRHALCAWAWRVLHHQAHARALRAERFQQRVQIIADDFTWTDDRHPLEKRIRVALAEAQEDAGALARLLEQRPGLRHEVHQHRSIARYMLHLAELEHMSSSSDSVPDMDEG